MSSHGGPDRFWRSRGLTAQRTRPVSSSALGPGQLSRRSLARGCQQAGGDQQGQQDDDDANGSDDSDPAGLAGQCSITWRLMTKASDGKNSGDPLKDRILGEIKATTATGRVTDGDTLENSARPDALGTAPLQAVVDSEYSDKTYYVPIDRYRMKGGERCTAH